MHYYFVIFNLFQNFQASLNVCNWIARIHSLLIILINETASGKINICIIEVIICISTNQYFDMGRYMSA